MNRFVTVIHQVYATIRDYIHELAELVSSVGRAVQHGWEYFKLKITPHLYHGPFLLLASGVCLYWLARPPKTNQATLALAVAAVVMVLGEMKPGHKAAWIVIVFALAFIENNAMLKEREEAEAKQEKIRNAQIQSFNAIAEGIRRVSVQSAAESKETIAQFTGDGSYAEIVPDSCPDKDAKNKLAARVIGKHRLSDVEISVAKLPAFFGDEQTFKVEYLDPGISQRLEYAVTPSADAHYQITILARNGVTVEHLMTRANPRNKQAEFSYKIEKQTVRANIKLHRPMKWKVLANRKWESRPCFFVSWPH